MALRRQLCRLIARNLRVAHGIECRAWFHEVDRQAGYRSKDEKFEFDVKNIPGNLRFIKQECGKLARESKRLFNPDPVLGLYHEDFEHFWKFNNQATIDSWITTSDSDNNEGESWAKFELGKNNTGIFHGNLCTKVPTDGVTAYSGYCNIKSPKNMKAFNRGVYCYDLSIYTHLLMRVRGDGRTYQMILGMEYEFDIMWFDQYLFPLYTRGGPYWQIAKIPFSKFILGYKGRIQDKQRIMPKDRASYFGITIGDDNDGEFCLEIDYIGATFDQNHNEQFDYEMYEVKPYEIYS